MCAPPEPKYRTFAPSNRHRGGIKAADQNDHDPNERGQAGDLQIHGGTATNTGSAEGQIALFTARIEHLTAHLRSHKKDHRTESALLALVGKRKQLLAYLKNHEIERYRAIIAKLGLRK